MSRIAGLAGRVRLTWRSALLGLLCAAAATARRRPRRGPTPRLRRDHRARPDRRWHRRPLVRGGRRHPRRAHRRHRAARRRPAKRRIDAAGAIVAPGFIDMLGQSELSLLVDPRVPSKIFQGITTEITGEGNSVAPVNAAIAQEKAATFEHLDSSGIGRDFAGYFARLERQHIGINLASYVGATTVREMVVGYADRAGDAGRTRCTCRHLVAEAMRQGAVGVSSSLEYAPAPYASTEELIALAQTAAAVRRHLRNPHALGAGGRS